MPRSKQNWISVKDGLPQDSGAVRIKRCNTYTGSLSASIDWLSDGVWFLSETTDYEVTDWMPLVDGDPVES